MLGEEIRSMGEWDISIIVSPQDMKDKSSQPLDREMRQKLESENMYFRTLRVLLKKKKKKKKINHS